MTAYEKALAQSNQYFQENGQKQISPSKTAASVQLTTNWLQSDKTQEVFSNITKEIESLEKQARGLACSFSTHQNPYQIINLLVRSNELRNLLETYGRINN